MDASTYGRMVDHGGYATGGVVQSTGFTLIADGAPEASYRLCGEHGPEISFASCCGYIQPATGLVSRSDTRITLTVSGDAWFGATLQGMAAEGHIQLLGSRDPDDGTAGVPAKV